MCGAYLAHRLEATATRGRRGAGGGRGERGAKGEVVVDYYR